MRNFYGYNGDESVDPEVIMKMMFLLFFDDVASERELMKVIEERLDYLWPLGYGRARTLHQIPAAAANRRCARTGWSTDIES